MNKLILVPFDKTDEKNADADLVNCRFFHGLNSNCQLEVLQYLSINDLLQVSKLGTYFKELISKWIIGNKLLNVDVTMDAWGKPEVLEVFGKVIRKIRANGNDYNFILSTIIDCCTPSIMTDIQILVTYMPSSYVVSAMKQPLPTFTNLQKLRIDNNFGSKTMVSHLKEIAATALNLQVLKVRGSNLQGDWLRTKHMKNLCELWMHTTGKISTKDLTYFIREHPKLEVFSFTGSEDTVVIGKCLSKYCKNLKKFYFEDTKEGGESDDNTLEGYFQHNANASNPYRFLTTFTNLNTIALISYKYINYPLMLLTSRHHVKELKIYVDLASFTNQCKFKYLIDSQSVEIYIRKSSPRPEKREACLATLQHIIDVVVQLKNQENITLCCGKKVASLHKLLEVAPNIRTLSISNVDFLHPPVEIRKIVRVLRTMRQESKYRHFLHLIVNELQFRELELYENENIMEFSIDPQLTLKRCKWH